MTVMYLVQNALNGHVMTCPANEARFWSSLDWMNSADYSECAYNVYKRAGSGQTLLLQEIK